MINNLFVGFSGCKNIGQISNGKGMGKDVKVGGDKWW